MQIRVLRNLAPPLPPYQEGEVVDADNEVAKKLIEQGLAEEVSAAGASKQAGAPPRKSEKEGK